MSDFETHERGTAKEIALSRALANVVNDHFNEMPNDIKDAYMELQAHYNYNVMGENFEWNE